MKPVATAVCLRVASAALSLGLPSAASAAGAEDWTPLVVGSTWDYETVTETRMQLGPLDRAIETRGEVIVTVEGLRDVDSSVRVLRSAIRNDTASGASSSAVRTDHLGHSGGALIWYGNGLKQSGAFIEVDDFHPYDPPHVLLKPPLSDGASWPVGTHEATGLPGGEARSREVQEARVVGRETVETPAGRFESCLRVDYRTTASMDVRPSSTQAAGDASGSEERTEWFAAGVGVVKRVTRSESRVRRPDGTEISMSGTATELLRRYRIGPSETSPATPRRPGR